jgi:glutamate-5-semialdehyde dehydrogenase
MDRRLMTTEQKNAVLQRMAEELGGRAAAVLQANAEDLVAAETHPDRALVDRLRVDAGKLEGMRRALREVAQQPDPVGMVLDDRLLPNGLRVVNRTVPFGTILIIYESRPDVTIEAAAVAFKAGSRILLKGGREAQRTNAVLWEAWQAALTAEGLPPDWVQLLTLDRRETQAFLAAPPQPIDLIVPRGGESLIALVQQHATCPVLISGRGNNFLFVDRDADWSMAERLIINGKLDKISACNALDKVLFDEQLPELVPRVQGLLAELHERGVHVWVAASLAERLGSADWEPLDSEGRWDEEFLDYKLLVGAVPDGPSAVDWINRHSGGHSACIVTGSQAAAADFLAAVDCAAVYHNASTRFTDGGQLGLGAELAISTAKLHHRGPLGLQQLVSNKYFITGNGQTRG